MRKIDITGMRFGKLVAIKPNGFDQSPSRKHIRWDCECDCGAKHNLRLNALRSGGAVSCGCNRRTATHKRTHNMTKTPEYQTWARIKSRCFNKNNQDYSEYGGRGIQMAKEWVDSFETFYADMGPRPLGMSSIDRIDPNGDYCKQNCRWADDAMQSRNKRNNVLLTLDGMTMCQSDWATLLGIGVSALIRRLSIHGVEKSLSMKKEK